MQDQDDRSTGEQEVERVRRHVEAVRKRILAIEPINGSTDDIKIKSAARY